MRHGVVAIALVAVGALAAIGWLARRGAPNEDANSDRTIDGPIARTLDVPGDVALAAEGASGEEAAVAEVRAMSPTYRNNSLLVAIRHAGFYCDDVVAANESADGVWLASCMDRSGYALSVRNANQFDVRPIAHYFDSVFPVFPPARDDQRPFDRGSPRDRLEPDRLR